MADLLEKFVGIDYEIVRQAKSDLTGNSPREALLVATWFFLDGKGIDEDDPKTFDGLCARNFIDGDCAARAIWDQLSMIYKARTIRLLREAGHKARFHFPLPLGSR